MLPSTSWEKTRR